jgi:hypothetical protein
MVYHYLSPGMIDCQHEDECNKRSYSNCTTCKENKVALEKHNKDKEKKNWFKRIR